MKYLVIVLLGLTMQLVADAAAAATPAHSSSGDTAVVMQLERDIMTAFVKKDAAKLLSIGKPDAWFIDSNGSVTTLKDVVAGLKAGAYTIQSMHVDDLKVRVFGDTAVAVGLETEQSGYKGKDSSGQYRFTDTWLKRDGRWLCVASVNMLVTSAKL
jgi:uncharacterized protein (TIGR02246 family)